MIRRKVSVGLVALLSLIHFVLWGVCWVGGFGLMRWMEAAYGGADAFSYVVFMVPAGLLSGPFCMWSEEVVLFASWDIADLPATAANSVLYGLASAYLFVAIANRRLAQPHAASRECQNFGYDLTGNVTGICPECGQPV